MISARNARLPGNNCDLHDAARVEVMKPTIDASGAWTTAPAASIDGNDKRVIRATLRAAVAVGLNLDIYDHPERLAASPHHASLRNATQLNATTLQPSQMPEGNNPSGECSPKKG